MIAFFFVDVFARGPLTGNPLTLVPDADGLDDIVMRAIAREFNQSETTFLVRPTRPGADWRLRSFTPGGAEVGGAGHNALGAWLWLAHTGRVGSGLHTQQIGDDVLEVEVEDEQVTMRQSHPTLGPPVSDPASLAPALGLAPEQFDTTRPNRVASTGAAHLLVPLLDRNAVDAARPDSSALLHALQATGAEGCYLYTVAGGDGVGRPDGAHAYTRFFNPTVGIAEDPATGTAAGPLAVTLVRDGTVADGSVVEIEQGHAVGRPSRLAVRVAGDDVRLSGGGLVVGEGRLTV